MRKFILLAFILFALSGFSNAQEPSWLTKLRQIEPLKSTEKDIERIFGKPVTRFSNIGEYENEAGELTVYYSEGKCRSSDEAEFDVEKGSVLEFNFSVRKDIKFKSLNIDLVGFKKTYETCTPDAFSYENEELGVDYIVRREG